MPEILVPLKWPAGWTDGSILRETPVNCVLEAPGRVQGPARRLEKIPGEVGVVEGVWARIRTAERGSGGAGPTGRPWVESNGWRVQLRRAMEPGKPLWVTAAPPANQVLGAEAYTLMAADCEAYGARWLVTLDEGTAGKVAAGEPGGTEAWRRLMATLRLFTAHPEWSGYHTVASVGVISDFEGDNEFLGHELLNLAARRPLPLRILSKKHAAAADWKGLGAIAVVETGKRELDPELQKKLTAFVEGGGLLIAPAGLVEGKPGAPRHDYTVQTRGKGAICAPKEEWSDPWQLAADIHLLAGREMDVLRVYNATSANVHYAESGDGARGVVHLISYVTRMPASGITVALKKKWKRARLLTPEQQEGRGLKVEGTRYGVEIPLPPFAVYAAIEVEG